MMRTWACVEYGQPLQLIERPLPTPKGTEVLVKNLYAGVCHSDLHNWEGRFNLGGGRFAEKPKTLLPHTLGHEMEGEAVALGPDVPPGAVSLGVRYLVFPWVGCGTSSRPCPACRGGTEQLCAVGRPNSWTDGASIYGGYASHVIVPHPRYLVDSAVTARMPEGVGCVYMCSGITAFSALKKVGTPPGGASDVLVMGCGGVGLQAVQFAKALFGGAPRAADVSPGARAAAAAMGCAVYDPADKAAVRQVQKDNGWGLHAVIDFVGSETTTAFGMAAMRPGGRHIVVGLFGGEYKVTLFGHVIGSRTLSSSFLGSLGEAHEMFDIVSSGRIEPIPTIVRPISEVNSVLQELREGKIVGRCILRHDGAASASL